MLLQQQHSQHAERAQHRKPMKRRADEGRPTAVWIQYANSVFATQYEASRAKETKEPSHSDAGTEISLPDSQTRRFADLPPMAMTMWVSLSLPLSLRFNYIECFCLSVSPLLLLLWIGSPHTNCLFQLEILTHLGEVASLHFNLKFMQNFGYASFAVSNRELTSAL